MQFARGAQMSMQAAYPYTYNKKRSCGNWIENLNSYCTKKASKRTINTLKILSSSGGRELGEFLVTNKLIFERMQLEQGGGGTPLSLALGR